MSMQLSYPQRLLFLPGALGTTTFWQPVAARLRCAGEHVFQRYPGFGGVPKQDGVDSFGDLTRLVSESVQTPTHLVAQSVGGLIALLLALQKPTLVRSLVLTATSGGLDTAALGASDWRSAFRQNHPHLPDWFARERRDLSLQLQDVGVPVLLLWGDDDPISPVAVGERLKQLLPNAKLVVIPGGDHDVAHSHAEPVAMHIQQHLERMDS